jgi:hypothetical protein
VFGLTLEFRAWRVSETTVFETNYSLNSRVNPNTFHI